MHILLVDSDKILQSTYAQALVNAGHTVANSFSAQDAISKCEEKVPDLVLLELQLQGHSGVELLHELRSYPEWQNIPVILHTFVPPGAMQGYDEAFKHLKIIGYAYKPDTTLKKLVSLVGELTPVNL